MLLYYAHMLLLSSFDPVFLSRRRFWGGSNLTLEEQITGMILVIIVMSIIVSIPIIIKGTQRKPPSKTISDKAVDKALEKNSRIYIKATYISGLSNLVEGCIVDIELFLDKLIISDDKTKATASLLLNQVLNVDVVESVKRKQDDSPHDTAFYFVIDYIDTKGEQQQIVCNKPWIITDCPLFMAVLERRCPAVAEASKAAAALEPPKHIDL